MHPSSVISGFRPMPCPWFAQPGGLPVQLRAANDNVLPLLHRLRRRVSKKAEANLAWLSLLTALAAACLLRLPH